MRPEVVIVGGLLLVTAALAIAQETTGDIMGVAFDADGLPLPGVTVAVRDPETGFEWTVVTDGRGQYRMPALAPSWYELTASREGFRSYRGQVSLPLGHTVTHDITMTVGAFSDVVEVSDEVPLVDVKSTVTGFVVKADDQMAFAPIQRDVTQIALMAPGAVASPHYWEEPGFGWGLHTPSQTFASLGGTSIGENGYQVNGLNITNFSYGLGASFVPMVFIDEVQVKTGGYEAEFGRATGAVINMVTKSGTNIFRGGLSVYWEPESLQEQEPDALYSDNQEEDREALELNAAFGGPILKDRLFFFAFVQYSEFSFVDNWAPWWIQDRHNASTPYWGGRVDWHISPAHRLEGTYLSDDVDVEFSRHLYNPLTREIAGLRGTGHRLRGGDNFVIKYTGILHEDLVVSAAAGRNEFDRTSLTDGDECPLAIDFRSGDPPGLGCWVKSMRQAHRDVRNAYRLDLDWFVGNHSLRAGADYELNQSHANEEFSGGVRYIYYINGEEGGDPSDYLFPDYPWDQELVSVSHYSTGGVFDTNSSAAYAQDSWVIRPGLTLNLGLRWERYENRNGLGQTFIETNDQWAPRLGAVWDPGGDGRSKLYGSFGIYYLPVASKVNISFASAVYDTESWYLFGGEINQDGSPSSVGDEVYSLTRADGVTPDPKEVLSVDFDPISQQELVIGYQRMLDNNWTVGVRAVARRVDQILDDYAINQGLYEYHGVECANPALTGTEDYCGHAMRLGNPGSDFQGWYDLNGDGELDPTFIPAEALGIPEAKRTRYAIELTAARRFANRWTVNGSYTWSHTYGNYGGVIDEELLANPSQTSTFFDSGTLMEHSSGDLSEDRRHDLKFFGMYAFDLGLSAGWNFFYQTGRPINSFGRHPTDPFAQSYYNPYTNSPQSFYTNGEPRQRGCCGRADDVWSLDLMLKYDFRGMGGDCHVRLDVFNLFNNHGTVWMWDFAETAAGAPNPDYGKPLYYQRPRGVRLGFGWSF